MSDHKIIVVKKKVKSHGGHHGGSWKVAYADFVTAMMAFFLVMWIMGMDEGARDLVQGYFMNPVGFQRSFSGGKNMLSRGNIPANIDIKTTLVVQREVERQGLEAAGAAISKAVGRMGLEGAEVETKLTDDGLRIELRETDAGQIFFDKSSAELQPGLIRVLNVVAGELVSLENAVSIEGHTDAVGFGGQRYTNWELSTDRANAARRALVRGGLAERRLISVRGLADREPAETDPYDPRNRRVSILLAFSTPDPSDPAVLEKLGVPSETEAGRVHEIPVTLLEDSP